MLPDTHAARRWCPLSGATPRQMVVLCHGIGGDAGQLAPVVPRLAAAAPDAMFVAPCAPERGRRRLRLLGRHAPGRQWFAIERTSRAAQEDGVRRAAQWLNRFIDGELGAAGLADAPYALVGFSQGAMTALFAGLRRNRPPSAIICFAGALLAPNEALGEQTADTRVVLLHGEQDAIVPLRESVAAADALTRGAVRVDLVKRPGLGHDLDAAGTDIAADYLQRAFA